MEDPARLSVPLNMATFHNDAQLASNSPFIFVTQGPMWSFAVSFPVADALAHLSGPGRDCIRVTGRVGNGVVGIGAVSQDWNSYCTPEQVIPAAQGHFSIDLPVSTNTKPYSLVLRSCSPDNAEVSCMVGEIVLYRKELEKKKPAVVAMQIAGSKQPLYRAAPLTYANSISDGVTPLNPKHFMLLLSHTSRIWDYGRCNQQFLRDRYADRTRLINAPPLDHLKPCDSFHPYSGALSIFTAAADQNSVEIKLHKYHDFDYKVQHATIVGGRLVLCFEDFILCVPSVDHEFVPDDFREGSPFRIDDPWFSGLQTVFPVSSSTCVASGTAGDCVLWVDVDTRTVLRRWRVPEDQYGINYRLTESSDLRKHFIHNDLQLAHLNCAYPLEGGACLYSTLGQGHVGVVERSGASRVVASGYFGCHGVRKSRFGNYIYFSDSCNGRIIKMNIDGTGAMEIQIDSWWLHDAEEILPGCFIATLGDRNQMLAINSKTGKEIGRFWLTEFGENVQFLSLVGLDNAST